MHIQAGIWQRSSINFTRIDTDNLFRTSGPKKLDSTEESRKRDTDQTLNTYKFYLKKKNAVPYEEGRLRSAGKIKRCRNHSNIIVVTIGSIFCMIII